MITSVSNKVYKATVKYDIASLFHPASPLVEKSPGKGENARTPLVYT